ncbi:MAG: tetratricopeptide repeat protein [Burkholderiales bacterium]
MLLRILRQLVENSASSRPHTVKLQLAADLYMSKRYDEAAALCTDLIRKHPHDVDALHRLGLILKEQGNLEAACSTLQKAHSLDDSDTDVMLDLAELLQKRGQLKEALKHYQAALELKPDAAPEIHIQIGVLHRKCGYPEEAVRYFHNVLKVDPHSWLSHQHLFLCYYDLAQFDTAKYHLERALALNPQDAVTRIRHAMWVPSIIESIESIKRVRADWFAKVSTLFEESDLEITDPITGFGAIGFYSAYQGGNDREANALAARLFQRCCPLLSYVAPHCCPGYQHQEREGPGHIRLGFFSKFLLRRHPVGRAFNQIIAQLGESRRFKVFIILFGDVAEEVLSRTPPNCTTVVVPSDLEQAQRQIADLGLDILVYADIGMEPLSNYLAFSRLAPVQCVMGGHPVTTGIPTVDYFVSSELLETPNAQEHYTEKLITFKSLPVSVPNVPSPDIQKNRVQLGLPEHRRLYVCPARLQKVHPEFDFALEHILKRDPEGELILFEDYVYKSWHEKLSDRFHQFIPDVVERIRFLPWSEHDRFMNILSVSDVILDTFHFGLGTTAFTVFTTGVPIVTLPSEFLRGRSTYACYKLMAITECVAAGPEDYVSIAVRLGTDVSFRQEIRARILARNSVLFNNHDVIPELKRFFCEAYQDSQNAVAVNLSSHAEHD